MSPRAHRWFSDCFLFGSWDETNPKKQDLVTPLYLGSDRLPGAGFSGLHLTRMVVDLPKLQDWVTSLDLQRKPAPRRGTSHSPVSLESHSLRSTWNNSLAGEIRTWECTGVGLYTERVGLREIRSRGKALVQERLAYA